MFLKFTEHMCGHYSLTVFEVTADSQGSNITLTQLSLVVSEARQVRQASWCVTVVVVSDDLAFLAAFAQWSLKGRLLVWSTRLLVVTRLHLHYLQGLHTLLSMTNSMLIIIRESFVSFRCSVYMQLPYSPRGAQALKVASWTPEQGLAFTSSLPLFPDKFSRLLQRPTLKLATEINPLNIMITRETAKTGQGGMLQFVGPMPDLVSYLATALNFSYMYLRPPDGSWGIKRNDGTWSGMMGMVIRQEVDVAVGFFGISGVRAEVVDFTEPIVIEHIRILGARGRPEVDPWGFVFPLEPLVWTAILATLLILPLMVFLLSSCVSFRTVRQNNFLATFAYLRILLNQNIGVLDCGGGWWWERVVLAVWGLVAVVTTQSYAGNLMALLAVRHISQPFQSLQDVLDHHSVITIWQKDTPNVQYFREVKSGIYREIGDLEKKGRLVYITLLQLGDIINTLVRRGDHVVMDVDFGLKAYMSRDFTTSGQCSFYVSREEFLPVMLAMVGHKGSALVSALSKRIRRMTEAGLFQHWMKGAEPNSTLCQHPPSKIIVQAYLSLNNIWGVFVILIAGHTVSVCVLCLELVTVNIQHV
ncbi:probable glutamate receptor [Procambarus clarkii]|uniref:probable glutamate receptor n=1 Tax=Procambarus clarkii TaxID=6728 RepID=UPI003742FDEF